MSEVGIVIVTYNSGCEIGACLDAALASRAEVLVVDNASSDGTLAEVARRGAHVIANSSNRGFAAAVNQGFAALRCPYILLLNPDVVIATGLEALRQACDLPRAAGAGGFLVDRQGWPQTGFMVRRLPTVPALIMEALVLNRILPNNPVNRRYRALDMDYRRRSAVEQPAGAFLMVRRAVWEELGGLDEAYWPLWFEDVDLCRRAADRGYLWYFVPEAVGKHTGAHSISRIKVEMRLLYWYGNLLRYAARHFSALGFRAVSLAVTTGLVLRFTAELAFFRNPNMAGYGKAVRFASRCALFGWPDRVIWFG